MPDTFSGAVVHCRHMNLPPADYACEFRARAGMQGVMAKVIKLSVLHIAERVMLGEHSQARSATAGAVSR